MHVIYLHGFASSPNSSKALFLGECLADVGLSLKCPDLNQPDFSTLTVSRMINQVEMLIDTLMPGKVALIGSSLGAFVAWHVTAQAERRAQGSPPANPLARPISQLVLLAPAFDFGTNGMAHLGPDGLSRWRATGQLEVDHHAEGQKRTVHYGLYEDAQRYDSGAVAMRTPTLILQGRQDELVDPAMVERFSAVRDHVTLELLDDDHQLKASLPRVWHATAAFFGVPTG